MEKIGQTTAISNTIKRFVLWNKVFKAATQLATLFLVLILLIMLVYLIQGSLPALHAFGLGFLIRDTWNPVTSQFGALVPILGTLVTASIALVFAFPLSLGMSIFIAEIVPARFQQILRIVIELLAGIPSIIYGMWGLFVLAPVFSNHIQPWLIKHLATWPVIGFLFQGIPTGIGLLTASIVLSIMIIPLMTAIMCDVFAIVPPLLKESAYALGATTSEVVWHVVLPYTRTSILGAVILALGRALGETMAVAFVIGNAYFFSGSLLAPSNSIAAALANEFTEATDQLYSASLIEMGLILFLLTFCLLLMGRWLLAKQSLRGRPL